MVTARRVAVVAGTPTEWDSFSEQEWTARLDDLGRAGSRTGVAVITLHPDVRSDFPSGSVGESVDRSSLDTREPRIHRVAGTTVVVDPCTDGRQRIASVVAAWPTDVPLDEDALGRAVCADRGEPDLVIVAGPADRLPAALVWELAYAELVYVDRNWSNLGSDDVHRALAQFAERERRFGGVVDDGPTGVRPRST